LGSHPQLLPLKFSKMRVNIALPI